MIQIFYKEKPIIISDKKSDLKNTLVIDLKLIKSVDILKILNKKKVSSIGIESMKPQKVITKFSKLFPEIIAAGGKVYNDNSEILFIYRNKKWDLPKGKAEKNETISQTALREVVEETGIKGLNIIKPLEKTFHIFKRGKKHYLKSTYWFEMKSSYTGEFKPQNDEGISRVEWVGAEDLDKILLKSYANIKLLIN